MSTDTTFFTNEPGATLEVEILYTNRVIKR